MAPRVNIVISSEDPERTYSPEEESGLTTNLVRLIEGIHSGAFSHLPINARLLQTLHYNIFHDIRGHAGRIRTADTGTEHLTFGPHRSCHRSEVGRQLDALFESIGREVARLQASVADEQFVADALRVAVRTHADVIWIHPFEDGNGRTCRSLMSCILVRLGLRPISMDAPRQEYVEALNHYYTTGEFEPLIDLALGLYLIGEELLDAP